MLGVVCPTPWLVMSNVLMMMDMDPKSGKD